MISTLKKNHAMLSRVIQAQTCHKPLNFIVMGTINVR
ncbi:hypothetical protein [Escherichia phage pEC-M719-6WT.1]|uniref:Uncharacterized protein n=1 Tax=Escherichia phage pEC-M719-6WT.1 TaxID=3056220 RepID=A0AA51U8T9_9CAUD|nr:hypothetical protein [Escherichia phage pEC-M719-6WT.1]